MTKSAFVWFPTYKSREKHTSFSEGGEGAEGMEGAGDASTAHQEGSDGEGVGEGEGSDAGSAHLGWRENSGPFPKNSSI